MRSDIEVELKFQILDEEQVRNFLNTLSSIDRRRIVDIYLDTENADLYKKGLFIRIRDSRILDFKYNLKDEERKHEHCEEHSFSLPLTIESLKEINKICKILSLVEIANPSLEEFKTGNNFICSVIIDKNRERYKDESFTFSLDDVKGLGKFLEIEAHTANEEALGKIKEKMRERLKGLKLKLITTGYNELYWKKHNIEIYRQGRYLLEGDKNEI
jgi:predicted adenylyl cyclase CyaB